QLTNPAQCSKADPYGALQLVFYWTYAGILLPSREGGIIIFKGFEALKQLSDFLIIQRAIAFGLVVLIQDHFQVDQVAGVTIRQKSAPRLALFGPAQHLSYVVIKHNHRSVQPTVFNGL